MHQSLLFTFPFTNEDDRLSLPHTHSASSKATSLAVYAKCVFCVCVRGYTVIAGHWKPAEKRTSHPAAHPSRFYQSGVWMATFIVPWRFNILWKNISRKFECFFVFFFWPQMLKTVEWRSKTRSFGDHRKKKEKKKSLCNVGKNVISLSKRTPNFISVYVLCPCSCAVSMCFCVLECYAVLHLPVVEMEGDMAGCSLSEEGEC